jgi:hypothetical protein
LSAARWPPKAQIIAYWNCASYASRSALAPHRSGVSSPSSSLVIVSTIAMSMMGVIVASLDLRTKESVGATYVSHSCVKMSRIFSASALLTSLPLLSIHAVSSGRQPTSVSLRKSTPPREAVAGEALRMCETSSSRRIDGVSGMRSLETRVSTLLSSITVFIDSIHSASMSPSRTTHLYPDESPFE